MIQIFKILPALFLAVYLSAQVPDTKDDVAEDTDGLSKKNLEESVEEVKKNILDKVVELEEAHKKLVELDPSQKKEIFIESTSSSTNSLERTNVFKYIKVTFQDSKATSIKLVTQKISQYNEYNYSKNTLEIIPPDLENGSIVIKTPEHTDISKLKDYYPQTKKTVLKVLFDSLHNAVMQVTFSVRRLEKEKEAMEKKRANF